MLKLKIRQQELIVLRLENENLYLLLKHSDDQPRDDHGRWTSDGSGSGAGLTGGGDSGTMDLSDSSAEWKPVTQESIESVQNVTCFNDPKLNAAVTENCKQILSDVKDDPVGTEETISLKISDLKPVVSKGVPASGTVKPITLEEPYISIHNHPSGKTFSESDVSRFISSENAKAICVVGNNGKVYILSKKDDYDWESSQRKLIDIAGQPNYIELLTKGADRYGFTYYES